MSLTKQTIKILIVDDQTTSRLLMRDALQQIGFANIPFAKDGEEALKMMMSSPAHIVVSDYNMPKLNGLQLLQAIRTYPATRITPFILLTGSGDREVLQKAVKLGVNNYLPKPVQPAALQKAIQAVTGNLPG
ncbi:response regulator [Aureimonas ureilytica]|uniref:response regulator n=1 Tax=Aureimonas ureilytica TaxID=401562 RepID=UPI00036F857E|nr:response regulator [Aureimonas ureilytica]